MLLVFSARKWPCTRGKLLMHVRWSRLAAGTDVDRRILHTTVHAQVCFCQAGMRGCIPDAKVTSSCCLCSVLRLASDKRLNNRHVAAAV
jgi:hypothetical protein